MKKFILTILITGLFLSLLRTNVSAKEAGDSAKLSLMSKINQKEIETMALEKKRMAIRAVLDRYQSPMAGQESSFVETCIKYNLDCYLLPSIAGLESTFGRFIWPNSNNPFGWGRGYIMFNDWSDGIDAVGKGLRMNYVNKGALDVYQIGPIYSESPTWAVRVAFFMKQFELEEEKLSLISSKFPVEL